MNCQYYQHNDEKSDDECLDNSVSCGACDKMKAAAFNAVLVEQSIPEGDPRVTALRAMWNAAVAMAADFADACEGTDHGAKDQLTFK